MKYALIILVFSNTGMSSIVADFESRDDCDFADEMVVRLLEYSEPKLRIMHTCLPKGMERAP